MEEKILNTRKNGMAVLLLTLLGYVASIALFIYSITLLDADRMLLGLPLLVLSIAYFIAGIFLFCAESLMITRSLSLDLAGDKGLLFSLEISAGTWKSGKSGF